MEKRFRALDRQENNPYPSLTRVAKTPDAPDSSLRLTVTLEVEGVVALPGLAATGGGLVEAVALSETAGLLASGGKAAGLAVLVDWGNDPVDAWIATDSLVLWVDENDLEVLVGGVLVDPVGVKDAQVGATAADTLLSSRLEGALVLQLVDSLVGWLACTQWVSTWILSVGNS